MVHIPFSGSAPSLAALMTGSTQFTIDPPASSLPLIQGGKLRALAVSSRQRLTALPDVPTIAESGFPSFEASSWAGIVVPANTPKDIILKLNQAISRASENKEFRAKFEPLGVLFAPSMSPTQIDASVKAEREQWSRIIQANNLKVN
jgi:tripartite-type tricarboxylate transporter receptor subunit TctC